MDLQLLGAYFNQDWSDDFETDDDVIKALSMSEPLEFINRLTEDLQLMISIGASDDEITQTLHDAECYFDPESINLTPRDWVEKLIGALKQRGAQR